MKKIVSVLITDIDNTLFDWVEMWFQSFDAMLNRLQIDSGIPREQLEKEFREIHQKYGTSEYSFSVEELPSLKTLHPSEDLSALYGDAIRDYRKARKASLRLYDGVYEALKRIRAEGSLIVGYTESMAFYTMNRLKTLGLDGVIDILYSPADHDFPDGFLERKRSLSADHYKLLYTAHKYTPKGELKPNPDILGKILLDLNIRPHQAVYVGDSLMKDIAMAQAVGVPAAFAKYGAAQHRSEYSLLRRLSHWKDEDIEREKHIAKENIEAEVVLSSSFLEVFDHFDFVPYKQPPTPEEKKIIVDVWKKIVDVQQHFNDLELRIRNFALTTQAAFLGFAGIAVSRDLQFTFRSAQHTTAVMVLFAGLVSWVGFYLMDRFWYHRLLMGAVKHGARIETEMAAHIPELGLTKAIGEESPFTLPVIGYKMHSNKKMDTFYGLGMVVYLVLIVVLW